MTLPLEDQANPPPLTALRNFARRAAKPVTVEKCELCSAPLAEEHQHLIELANRRVVCACDACALLFDQSSGVRYRRVPRRGKVLADFELTDSQWDGFLVPINMAFFYYSTPAEKIVAMYPSPAGATESLLSLDAWQNVVEANPALQSMQPDVEALLVNRLGAMRGFAAHEYYLAPIDECYRLVGLLRTHWRGFAGGTEVWQHMGKFFSQLADRSSVVSAARKSA